MTHKHTSRKSSAPPAIDAQGKSIPRSARWGYSTDAFANGEGKSNFFVFVLITLFAACNQTKTAHDLYTYIDVTFTPFQVNFLGTFLITTIVYWLGAGLFAIVDLTNRPRFLFKYKVQPFHRVGGKEYLDIAAIVIRNQLFVVLPLIYARACLVPSPIHPSKMNGPWNTIFNLIFNVFCTEAGFYFVHRFFHTPWMYQRFHKQHHRMTAPVALSATYCTMTEHVFSNLLPNVIGTSILQPHWSVGVFTFCLLEATTLCAHSGYNIPYLYSSLQHDWHHFAFSENFGPMGLFDALLGTGKRFHSVMREGMTRHAGQPDKAREELLHQLASWEAEVDVSSSLAPLSSRL